MSRRCELTGKGAQVGHKVSHSNIKTKRRFLPNLLNVTMISDALGRSVRLRVSANALKSVDHPGAAADRHSGKTRRVARIELALGVAVRRYGADDSEDRAYDAEMSKTGQRRHVRTHLDRT